MLQKRNTIELLNNNSHGLSPPGGLVSPSGGFLSLMCDQGLHFASIKLCLALSHQGAIIKIPVVRCHCLWCLGAQLHKTWFDFQNFHKNWGFSWKQKNLFFTITIWLNFHAVIWNFSTQIRRKMFKKNVKMLRLIKKKCLRNIWMAP